MKKTVIIIAGVYVIIDLVISFLQYYYSPVDGDLIAISLPAPWYQDVLNDPTGLKTLLSGNKTAGAGRFTAHYTMFAYFNYVPAFLQYFTSPVESIYLAMAIFKTITLLLFLNILSKYVEVHFPAQAYKKILTAAMILPFVQYYGYYNVMGLVDHATTYVFFYLWPVTLGLYVFLPAYKSIVLPDEKKMPPYLIPALLVLAAYTVFCGPLMPPLFMLGSIFCIYFHIKNKEYAVTPTRILKQGVIQYMILLFCLGLYAFILGSFNSESYQDAGPAIAERYLLLLLGIGKLFSQKIGLVLLFIYTAITSYISAKKIPVKYASFKKIHLAFGLFALAYLILLPLGGYRSYRPLIVRYDTFIPVLVIIMLIFLQVHFLIFREIRSSKFKAYSFILPAMLLIYINADHKMKNENACEKEALETIARSRQDTVYLNDQCHILSWVPVTDPYISGILSQKLKKWNIIEREKIFIQRNE